MTAEQPAAASPSEPRPLAGWGALAATVLVPWVVAVPTAGPWLLPLVAPLTLWWGFRARVESGRVAAAWGLGMAWAALLSLGVLLLTWLWPDAAAGIPNGEAYREEMFTWISTGVGPENDPSRFLPQHALHLGVFLLLTGISGGYLGLSLGALLMAYMSYFVASYGAAADALVMGSLAAWVPWSVVRVAAFVLLGVLFARPLLARRAWPFDRSDRRWFLLAAAGILTDITLKTVLAPTWGELLRRLAGGAL